MQGKHAPVRCVLLHSADRCPSSLLPAAEAEIRDELLALRLLRGDFAFATPLLEGGARAKLAERLAANKRRAGSFLGGGAGTSAFAGAAAAAKEE